MAKGLLIATVGAFLCGCAAGRIRPAPAAPVAASPAAPAEVWNDGVIQARQGGVPLSLAKVRSRRLVYGTAAAVVAFGATVADLGTSTFFFEKDDFFGASSDFGGADKTGHATSSYIQVAIFSELHRRFGFAPREAARRGAITAFITQTVVEVGDGFAEPHGFSWHDMAANTVGVALGYLHETHPRFREVFDFRWEYFPSKALLDEDGEAEGIFTDYEGSAYLAAVDIGALTRRHRRVLDLVEVQAGYKTRGYLIDDETPERIVFVGVGPSLPTVFRRLGWRGVARFFEYYQPPGISLRWELSLDD